MLDTTLDARGSTAERPLPTPPRERSPLEWVGLCLGSWGALYCFYFAFLLGPALKLRLSDSGTTLPLLTEAALTSWVPGALGLAITALAAFGAWGGSPPQRRRRLLFATLLLAAGGYAFCVYAMYAPIFAVAEGLKG